MVCAWGLPGSAGAQGYHRVAAGETLDAIARRYRVPVYEIAKANRLDPSARPTPGTQIYVPRATKPSPVPAAARTSSPAPVSKPAVPSRAASAPAGDTITVPAGGSLWSLARKHGVTVEALAAANGLKTTAGLAVGQKLRLPGRGTEPVVAAVPESRVPPEPAAPEPARGGASSSASSASSAPASSRVSARGFVWPVEGRVLKDFVDSFREKHAGLDIAAPVGTPVRAAQDGTVVWAGKITTYGRMVIVQHTGGLATCYAYNSEILVRENQTVKRGQTIARSGDPGKGDRPYLHFQMRRNGDAIDPRPWLP